MRKPRTPARRTRTPQVPVRVRKLRLRRKARREAYGVRMGHVQAKMDVRAVRLEEKTAAAKRRARARIEAPEGPKVPTPRLGRGPARNPKRRER